MGLHLSYLIYKYNISITFVAAFFFLNTPKAAKSRTQSLLITQNPKQFVTSDTFNKLTWAQVTNMWIWQTADSGILINTWLEFGGVTTAPEHHSRRDAAPSLRSGVARRRGDWSWWGIAALVARCLN